MEIFFQHALGIPTSSMLLAEKILMLEYFPFPNIMFKFNKFMLII